MHQTCLLLLEASSLLTKIFVKVLASRQDPDVVDQIT